MDREYCKHRTTNSWCEECAQPLRDEISKQAQEISELKSKWRDHTEYTAIVLSVEENCRNRDIIAASAKTIVKQAQEISRLRMGLERIATPDPHRIPTPYWQGICKAHEMIARQTLAEAKAEKEGG